MLSYGHLNEQNVKKDKALGYLYFFDSQHPLSNSQGKVYVHRHVLSVILGRWIKSWEHAHHCDGNRSDNSPSNLRLVTPREHAQLHHPHLEEKVCAGCNKKFSPHKGKQLYCSYDCRRILDPRIHKAPDLTKKVLEEIMWKFPTTKIAQLYGLTDKAIEKRCKKYGINKPPRGYWAKQAAIAQLD